MHIDPFSYWDMRYAVSQYLPSPEMFNNSKSCWDKSCTATQVVGGSRDVQWFRLLLEPEM